MTDTAHVNSREQRQIQLLRAAVGDYRAGRSMLGELVEALESAKAELICTPEPWRVALHDLWFDLEQVHAVGLDRDYDQVLAENATLVSDSVAAVTNLLHNWPSWPSGQEG